MGNCSSDRRNLDPEAPVSGREDGPGIFVVSTKPNKATVVSATTHSFSPGANRSKKGKVKGMDSRSLREKDKRRESMQVPGDFYLGLDVSFEDITLEESVGRGQFGEVFRAHIEGKRVAVKQIFIHGTAEVRPPEPLYCKQNSTTYSPPPPPRTCFTPVPSGTPRACRGLLQGGERERQRERAP